ncbi:hypothetical protein Tco_1148938 [Tanacetum coccineum]
MITPPTTQTDTTVIPTETSIIAPTIPPSPNYTPASPDYSPAFDTESNPFEDPSSDHIPPLPAISPFLSLDDDTTESDTPDTPPSPTYGKPFTEITSSTHRSPVIPRRRVMILAPGQPIPHGRLSPMASVPALPPVFGALSLVRADLIPSPKRVRDSGYLADVEAKINECFAYANTLRDRGIDARVVVEAVDREERETGTGGSIKVRVERVTYNNPQVSSM